MPDIPADVVYMWTHNGAPLVQYDCSGTANQHFRIEPVGGGYYRIVAEHSNKALDIEGVSYQGGARVTQWEYVGGANQQWSIEATDSGYVRLIARHSGKAMEVAGGGGATQNGADVVQWDYVGGTNQQWQLRGVSNSNTVKWLVNDHLGTPRMIADLTGSLAGITRRDYLPFGEELTTQGGRNASQGYGQPNTLRERWATYERDDETGLDFAQARYYSSIQGRFTSPDEFAGGPDQLFTLGSGDETKQALPYADITEPQTLNKYQYCLNNPLRYVDIDGHQNQDGNTWTEWFRSLIRRILTQSNPEQSLNEDRTRAPLTYDRDQVNEQLVQNAGRGMEITYDALDTTGLDFGALHFVRSLVNGDNKEAAVAAGFFAVNVATAGRGKGAVVLGETMATRVIPVAERIGADVYKPTSKVAANWLANNARWIKSQIAGGKRIFDIGVEQGRTRSPYYRKEVELLKKAGLERIRMGTVSIKNKTFTVYEWVRPRRR